VKKRGGIVLYGRIDFQNPARPPLSKKDAERGGEYQDPNGNKNQGVSWRLQLVHLTNKSRSKKLARGDRRTGKRKSAGVRPSERSLALQGKGEVAGSKAAARMEF